MSLGTSVGRRRSRRIFFARRQLTVALATIVSLSGVTVIATATPVVAAPVSIALDKSAPKSVLVGEPITFSVKATNPADDGDADFQYNLSFRDVLPAGVAYVSTSAPTGAGDPQQIAERDAQNQPTGRTILVWSNLADLPDAGDVTLTYTVQPDADAYPVGDKVVNQATGYVSKDERRLPRFDARGTFVPDAVISQASDEATTSISALELQKSEPSSERELTRGVHDRPTVYSLKVINNGKESTSGVKVVDYLPAGLEFLGCGAVDNSAPGFQEYPGSGRLTGTPAIPGCLQPTSVTTVNTGIPDGYAPGVYTRVEWTLPSTLGPHDDYTIRYAAGIPLRENVMPPAGAFAATANLDNNTGRSTRETAGEISYTNVAVATGFYQGVDVDGNSDIEVSATDDVTVTSEDIAVAKSITNGEQFAQGGVAEYALLVRTSEYTDGSDIVLVDTLPDGLCPADAPASTYTSAALSQATGDCAPSSSGNAAIEKVDFVGGVFVITFAAFDLTAADASTTIAYKAKMRETYLSDGEETSAGDTYTNRVALTGTTTPIGGTSESGTRAVKDDSRATLGSDAPQLDKRVLKNTAAPHSCNDSTWTDSSTGNWFDSQTAASDAPFTIGSRVCFQVRVTFPNSSSTRLPVVTDYLPDNLAYEPGSFQLVPGVNTAPLAVDQAAITAAFAEGRASFRPGTDIGQKRYVEKGQVFAFRLSAIVQANDKSVVDVQGNLAKLRWTDRAGRVSSLRDKADFQVPPVPPVSIDKQVAKAPFTDFANSRTVKHGDVTRYRVAVTNDGTTPVSDIEVWDVLPPTYRCADLVAGSISDAGTCTDPGDTGHGVFVGSDTKSKIRWVLPATVIADGTTSVRYDVTVPAGTSVGTTYVNTAGVTSFTTPTNLGGVSAAHYPADNLNGLILPAVWDAPAANDTASVDLPPVGLTKTNVTSVVEPGNTAAQAVAGETVTYTIRATVPARTTVYNGVLTDPMPTNLTFVSASAGYSATGADPATDALPTGTTLNAANGTLTLPATWTNSTDDDQVFEVTVVARVAPATTTTATRTNTATFASKSTLNGANVTPVTATSNVSIVQPNPTLTKALAAGQSPAPLVGETRDFVLRASNATSTPTLHDTVVVDCVPAGLTVTALGAGATQAPAAAGDACASVTGTGTVITWNAGSIVAGTAGAKSLTYTVRVDDLAAGGQTYRNTATLTGSTLANGVNSSTVERVITQAKDVTLTVPGSAITKTVADPTLTIGEDAEYTVTGRFPAGINFYNAAIIDVLPVGIDVSTLQTTSVTCEFADGSSCTLPSNGTTLSPSVRTVGWYLGDLTSNAQARIVTVKYKAKVADTCTTAATAACNTIGKVRTNSASVKWNLTSRTAPTGASAAFDRTVGPATANVTIQEPRTTITKSVDDATPAPGQVFTYSVTAANPGGTNVVDAHHVVVKDVVPAGVVIDEDTISGGGRYDVATRTITWEIDVLTTSGADRTKTFTYEATLAASADVDDSTLTNTATVTGFESLPTGGREYTGPNDTADVTPAFPHVSIAKRVVGNEVSYVGSPQNFEIVVTSDGDSPAFDVDVTDVLPKNWSFDAATVKVGDAAAIPLPPSNDGANPQTLVWSDLAATGLAPGKTIVITYTATPQDDAVTDPGAGSDKEHVNTASVTAEDETGATSSGEGAYNGGPDDATARIHAADLQVTKTGTGTPVAGDSYSWKIAVKNNGGDPAVGPIVVKDEVPDNVTGFSLSGAGWNCSPAVDEWTCTLPGPLASGASATDITATGTIDSDLADGTEIVNSASVAGRTFDPDTDNNDSESTTKVTTLADLEIVKKLSSTLVAGQNATWTLDVRNLGPSTSRGDITVVDTLPADSTFVSATGAGWQCKEVDGTVTCVRAADLPATGQTSAGQITIVAKIAASQSGAVVNEATVSGTTKEPITTDAEENNSDDVTTPPAREASLFLQKSLKGADPAVAGAEATYVLDVLNNGPSTATDVTIKDTLPSYLTYVSGGNADWDCSAAGQVVTCELDGSLGVGADEKTSVEITVKVASGHTGNIVNTATVTATEHPTGSTDGDTNTPDLKSDLQVTKTHTGDATAGKSIEYGITVKNNGPSDTAGPIVVKDTVPAGMTYSSVSGAGWACGETGGTVTCEHQGGLTDGQSRSLDLTFDVAVDAGPASVVNNVSVDGPNTDPTPGNNVDSDPTEIVDDANVTVTKTAGATSVHAGANVTWTIDVENEGPSTADEISVSDTLPAGLTIVRIDGPGWDCDEDTLFCTRDPLDPGKTPPITVVTKVGSGVASGTTLTNRAVVTTSTPGDVLGDNADEDDVKTTTSADLSLVKSHTGTPVAGTSLTFDLAVKNNGPSDAQGPITITDQLPAGMTYVSNNDAWSCLAGPVSVTGQEVVCTLVTGGPIVADDDAPALAMVVDLAADQSGNTLVNSAEVDSPTTDPTPGNNADDDTVTPTDEVDLAVTKSHTGPVKVGEQLTFTIGVRNDGPSEARDVEVADALPKGLTFVSATGTGWTCAPDGATCTLDDPLAPGADAEPLTVVVDVTPDAYPGVTNVATVSTSSNDTDDSNDQADDDVVVPAKVDLSVVKKAEGKLRVGGQGSYSLTVRNDGPTADPGVVTVTDELPAGLTYVKATASGWECGAVKQLVTCERAGDFAVGASETIDLTVDVGAAAYPSVVNTAQVGSPSEDTDPDDNTSTVTTPVAGNALLSITKELDEQEGRNATWSIVVTNEGPTETTAPIVVKDKLPKQLTFVSAKGAGWSCEDSGRTITCEYTATLGVGDSAEILVKTRITADDGSEIVNVASVRGGDVSSNGTQDTDDATVTAPDGAADDASGLLPDAGGAALWLLLAGLLLVAGGTFVATRRRQPQPAGRHR